MKTLPARALQRELGKVKPSDLPLAISKYGSTEYILISAQEYASLLEIADYEPKEMQRKIDAYESRVRYLRLDPQEVVVQETDNGSYEGSKPVKKTDASGSFVERMKALGMDIQLGA
jgi:PHD/YefM family antitoxin component YafN of YafNO toxin-antitoxin module